nr:MAG TPA: hypothetical protein [Caudoviricetes sp.]
MDRLRAIWNILFANQYAVFTFKDAAPDPTWLKVPTFSWVISHNDSIFFSYIKERIKNIEEYNRLKDE